MRLAAGITLTLLLVPATAAADGEVMVRVTDSAGRPMDAAVTLSNAQGERRCRTVASRCTIQAPRGRYSVRFAPLREQAPGTIAPLDVPDRGSVVLSLRSRPEPPPESPPATHEPTSPVTTAALTGAIQAPTASAGPRVRTGSRPESGRPSSGALRATGTDPLADRLQATTQDRPSMPRGRNLARGRRVVVQGNVVDRAGRPTDASVYITSGARAVGYARTVAGRFSLLDLAPGTYRATVHGRRGGQIVRTLRVSRSGVSRVVFHLP